METKALKDNKSTEIDKGPTFGIRHLQVVFLFCLAIIVYGTRFGFSVSLVAMTQQNSPNPDVPIYNWTNTNILLSTFFWGYVVPQLPTGILSTKQILPIYNLSIEEISRELNLKMETKALKDNKSTEIDKGYTIGIITGLTSTGFMCASWTGWPLSFYVLPSFGLAWVVLYYFFGAAKPSLHSMISVAERNYIEQSLNTQNIGNICIPFKSILTSVPFLSTITMALCSGWGFCIFTTELPIYMNKVMRFDIRSNGILSSLPHICTLLSGTFAAFFADYLISRNYLSVGATRKIMSSIGSLGCSVLLLIVAYMPTGNRALVVVIITVAAAVRSLNTAGFNVNHLDLAPNFGSTLMGMTNTGSELFSLITPIAIQYIVYNEEDQHLWRIVFLTAVGFYIFSTIIFVTFGSGERQRWNYVQKIDQEEDSRYYIETGDREKI
uniref:Inorganic phosphate cotransporter n=1 Tax=Diabrotica virgifera virgifera TaxID=50390 RepID=A0A6P7F7A5_DIAVI